MSASTGHILIDTLSRDVLTEGRRKGLGYGFCKRLDDGNFETVSPISACKDYLSDVVWSEQTGKSATFYGFTSKKTGLFDGGVGYLAMKILKHNGGTYASPRYQTYDGYENEIKTLKKNYQQMEKMAHFLEERVGETGRTIIEPLTSDGDYIVHIPRYWIACHPRISLYTLLLRFAMWGFKADAKDPWADMASNLNKVGNDDSYFTGHIIPKVKQLLNGWRIDDDGSTNNPHSNGFFHYAMLPPKK